MQLQQKVRSNGMRVVLNQNPDAGTTFFGLTAKRYEVATEYHPYEGDNRRTSFWFHQHDTLESAQAHFDRLT